MTHSQFVNLVHKFGGKVEVTSWPDYNVEAPRGYTWDGNLHCMVVGYTSEGRIDFFTRFAKPVPCTNPDCEYCADTPKNNDPRCIIQDIQL